MPGTKRKIDEDTWIVSQSKKFKQGVSISSVYETTLAHLRMGARNFFTTLMSHSPSSSPIRSTAGSPVPSGSVEGRPTSPYTGSPPGSPLIRDVISENELQRSTSPIGPAVMCQDCRFRSGRQMEETYGKCAYCDKLVCHLNSCRGCELGFCGGCSIAKYDDSNSDAYECYSCLH